MANPAISGAINVTSPTGQEVVAVTSYGANGPGPQVAQMTTQQIASLGGTGTQQKSTSIATAGAGTLTAPAIVGGNISRTGSTANFTDTTATAAQIVAAIPGAFAGQSFYVTIKNGTAFAETIQGGIGVTVAANTIVPGNSISTFLVTLDSLTAVSFFHVRTTGFYNIPPAQFTTAALSVGTLAAGAITGANFVVLTNTGATPGAQTVRTAAQMLADFPQARVGQSFMFRIVNTGAGTLTLTADGGATVTITGTATVAQNVFRDYILTFNTATTATIQSVGSGVSP